MVQFDVGFSIQTLEFDRLSSDSEQTFSVSGDACSRCSKLDATRN